MNNKEFCFLVISVDPKGAHGPYAVAVQNIRGSEKDLGLGSVTFSLDSNVWEEPTRPSGGTWVVLSQFERKAAGWRANKARLFKPEDDLQSK